MITYIQDTPKGREYHFSTRMEEQAFRLFWQMGFITVPNEAWNDIQYRGYLISPVWNYTNGDIDANIFKEDAETGQMFQGTVEEAKESIDDTIDAEQSIKDYLKKFNPK